MKDANYLKQNGVDVDKALELLGDMDMYNEVMHDFLDMINDKINSLNNSKSKNDMANYAIDVHSLKSDVRYLGFMALGDLAYELELKSKANDISGVSEKHDTLIEEVNKMINICNTYLYGEAAQTVNLEHTQPLNINLNNLDPMSEALIYQQGAINVETNTTNEKNGIILIVDDSEIVANFVKKVFNDTYEVIIASDGAQAINIVSNDETRSKIKACLLDLNMPNVNGLQVLENFKQNNYFVRLPVAVISGVEDMESLNQARSYPIIDVLQKPFNERDIKYCVDKCLATYF